MPTKYVVIFYVMLSSEITLSSPRNREFVSTTKSLTGSGTQNKLEDDALNLESEELLQYDSLQESQQISEEGSGNGDESGIFINIQPDDRSCRENQDGPICSNKGKCTFNRCICDSYEANVENITIYYRYSGRYCEECPHCRGRKCKDFLPCIECNTFQPHTNCNPYCQFKYKIVENLTVIFENDEKFCDVENLDGCYFAFKYSYDEQNDVILEYAKDYICFNGYKIVMFTFWGVVAYVFALAMIIPKAYSCRRIKNDALKASRISISTGHDVLRRFNRDY